MSKVEKIPNVSMEKRICGVCGNEYETGAILSRKRMIKNPPDVRFVVTGKGFCPDCRKILDDGYVALIVTSSVRIEERINPDDIYRTGEVLFIKKDFAEKYFDMKPEEINAITVESCVKLKAMIEKLQCERG